MDPSDILFTTPTLNDALPSTSNVPASEDCYAMHEDDWRQFEFVSSRFSTQVAAETVAIDRIWREQSVPVGEYQAFRECHIRKAIPQPLNIPFSSSELETLFGTETRGITIVGYGSELADVYAVHLDGVIVYAQIAQGKLTALGLEPTGPFVLQGDAAARMEQFLSKHDVMLVHWRSRTVFSTPAEAMQYLMGKRS
ncbi:MAG: hypothetical protein IH624_06140 [Phycisphaerae bacterium]|nr:hypothetical protein [Phycisphaerae bacterium]